jgi:hypothetical protein
MLKHEEPMLGDSVRQPLQDFGLKLTDLLQRLGEHRRRCYHLCM